MWASPDLRARSPAAAQRLASCGTPKSPMWTPPFGKCFSELMRVGRLRSYVRPVRAASTTAGLDAIRGSAPNQSVALDAQDSKRALPIPGSTGSHHLIAALANLVSLPQVKPYAASCGAR